MQQNGHTTVPETVNGLVACKTSQGLELRASVLRLTRHLVVFEVYDPNSVLQTSEVLAQLKIELGERAVYSGRAVVSSLINTGAAVVCEATLSEGWIDIAPGSSTGVGSGLRQQYAGFMQNWQNFCRVLPEFKVVMADMQSFLSDLRHWLEQVELGIAPSASAERPQLEAQAIEELIGPIVRSIDTFVDKFETIAGGLEADLHPVHCAFLRRQLHPLLMSSPFAHRTLHKPLGYAGDYEMVNMMMRSPYEGSTLFGKIINVWLLGQAPARAHRNRVAYLVRKLVEEAARTKSQGRPMRVLSVGCGPALEVQAFLREHAVSTEARVVLIDFNEETLVHVRTQLEETKRRHHRNTSIQYVKRSVHHILKESGRSVEPEPGNQYDYIYCAGLFDYLSDQVCKRLMNFFYNSLAPGGLLLATNVSDALNTTRPFRYSMEYMLDWHLIYRDGRRMAMFAPDSAPPDGTVVFSEESGVNVVSELRKPNCG